MRLFKPKEKYSFFSCNVNSKGVIFGTYLSEVGLEAK